MHILTHSLVGCARGMLLHVPERFVGRPCEVGVWLYYRRLKVAALAGTALYDGTTVRLAVLHHAARDLHAAKGLTGTLRARVIYGLCRFTGEGGTLHYVYVLPSGAPQCFAVVTQPDAEAVYYDMEATLPAALAPQPHRPRTTGDPP